MSFGLHNVPTIFQCLMNVVVLGLEGCTVYLDDVIISRELWDVHVQCIRALFDCLAEAHLIINLAKCEFASVTVVHLGRVIGQGQVHPIQVKV